MSAQGKLELPALEGRDLGGGMITGSVVIPEPAGTNTLTHRQAPSIPRRIPTQPRYQTRGIEAPGQSDVIPKYAAERKIQGLMTNAVVKGDMHPPARSMKPPMHSHDLKPVDLVLFAPFLPAPADARFILKHMWAEMVCRRCDAGWGRSKSGWYGLGDIPALSTMTRKTTMRNADRAAGRR